MPTRPLITVRTFVLDSSQNLYFESDTPAISASSGSSSAGQIPFLGANGKLDPSFIPGGGGGTVTFDGVFTGVNTGQTLSIGDGSVLAYEGTGTINANEIGSVNVTGNEPTHPGQVLISQPGNTTAVWADPQVQGLYAEGSTILSPPAYTPPTTIQPVLVGGRGTSPSGQDGLLHSLPLTPGGQALFTVPNPQLGSVSGLVDGYARTRVSSAVTLFEGNYMLAPAIAITGDQLQYSTAFAGSGAIQRNNPEPAIQLSVGTDSGARAVWQTKAYWIGQAGKSLLIQTFAVLGANVAGCIQRIGFYDDLSGYFFEQNGVTRTARIVNRSLITGLDIPTEQSVWNIDKMDGTGSSGITLDFSKTQVFCIDVGSFRIRFGFYIGGVLYYVHQMNGANSATSFGQTTIPIQPIRYEILNSTASAGNFMKTGNASVVIEGGYEDNPSAYAFACDTGDTMVDITTMVPIISISPSLTIGGHINRSFITLRNFSVITTGGLARYQLIYNGTLTGANFQSVNAGSAVVADIAATQITGGRIVDSGYIGITKQEVPFSQDKFTFRLPFALNLAGSVGDIYTIAIAAVGNGTVSAAAAFKWQELR